MNKAHVKRKYADVLKAIKNKEERKGTPACDALKQIGWSINLTMSWHSVCQRNDSTGGNWIINLLADAYFEWIKNTKMKSCQNPSQEKPLPVP